ncbi:acyltransferase family protein [Desulfococcaceae bacterium HSG9]|nr:acyltransferase family protein [Desulfococcaceae bacterium HSG9]
MGNRILWIDNLKAIAIFFVVIGHTVGLPETIEKLIFSFHMPVFFWLSGMLVKDTLKEIPFLPFLKAKAKKRLIPYLYFSVISYILWFALFRHFGTQAALNIPPVRPLIGIFYGNGINYWLVHNTVLWFFLCLFITEIMFFYIIRIPSRRLLFLILFILSIIGYIDTYINKPDGFRLPWNIDIALTLVVFYGLGYALRKPILSDNIFKRGGRLADASLIILAMAFYIISSLLNDKVAVVAGLYGNYFLFYIAALSGIFFWIAIAKRIPQSKLFSKVGDSTLIIFPMHLLVFPFLTAIQVYIFKLPASLKHESVILSILYAVISILILLPVADIIYKKFPFILGIVKRDG